MLAVVVLFGQELLTCSTSRNLWDPRAVHVQDQACGVGIRGRSAEWRGTQYSVDFVKLDIFVLGLYINSRLKLMIR